MCLSLVQKDGVMSSIIYPFHTKVIISILVLICLIPLLFSLSDYKDRATETQTSDELTIREDDSTTAVIKKKIINSINRVVTPPITVFVISMLPIIELRGAIPVGINHFNLSPILVFLLSVTGNMVPIFFILLFFKWVTKIAERIPLLKKFLSWLIERTKKRSQVIEKYEEIGLIFFVAIPLPVTGAWTGSLAAYLLGLDFWKSILCILLGVLFAGLIVTSLSILGWLGAIIALTVLSLFLIHKLIVIGRKKMKRDKGVANGSI